MVGAREMNRTFSKAKDSRSDLISRNTKKVCNSRHVLLLSNIIPSREQNTFSFSYFSKSRKTSKITGESLLDYFAE